MNSPIGIFDSGLGGLTVAAAIRARLPRENLVYFGDTARVPYGTKSAATIQRFTAQCLRFLLSHEPKLLVVACNTASALALEELKKQFKIPILGVLEPGAQAAVEVARQMANGRATRIGLIATEATINSGAYAAAVRRLDSRLHVLARACPLLVPIIEEGRDAADPLVTLVLKEYLQPFMELDVSALILGCTHYPILAAAIQSALPGVTLIDSARQTALVVAALVATMPAKAPGAAGGHQPSPAGTLTCYVTDQGQRFERLATRFLGQPVGQPIWVTPEMLESSECSL